MGAWSSYLLWGGLAGGALYAIVLYNQLVALRLNTNRNMSNIHVLLKQRNDELPKLVEVCRRYMAHEETTLVAVIKARNAVMQASERGDVNLLGKNEALLKQSMSSLLAVAEEYPELKANEVFKTLLDRVVDIENSIADRREFYNDSVNIYNTRIQQFPDAVIARLLNFQKRFFLQFQASEMADPDMKSLFKS